MLAASKYTEALEALCLQFVLWQHAFDSFFNNSFWVAFTHFFELRFFDAARETTVTVVILVGFLVASNDGVCSVDNHDVVATINVRCVGWLVFTGQVLSNFSCQAPQW